MTPDATRSPRLSVGLPTYNGEEYLASALDSLLAQTFTDFELIISDNASTDATESIARAYAARDPRIRYVRHPQNRGSAFNHTYVIREARGEYFKWASDDDLYAPDLLERCVEALDARPEIPMAHAWTASIDATGDIVAKLPYVLETDSDSPVTRFRSLLYTDGGDDIYGVIRTRIVQEMPDYGSFYHSDRTFVAELALHGPFHQVPDHLYFRREHSGRGGQASLSMRRIVSILDPARASAWRHPKVRLVAEYLAAYVAAIRRAPIGPRQKAGCLWALLGWIAGYARRLRRHRDGEAGEPPPSGGQVRSVAFYGLLGSGNLGNDASLETLLWWFDENLPEVSLACITIAPAVTRARYGLRSLALAGHRSENHHEPASVSRRLIGRLLDLPNAWRVARSADAVVIPGMGVLEDTLGTRPWGVPAWLFSVALACRLARRRFVLLGVGAAQTRNPVTRWLFHRQVGLASYVSYRDQESATAMSGSGRTPDAVGSDIAFAHPAPVIATPQPGLVVIGVMDYHGEDRVRRRAVHERYVADMVDVVGGLVAAGDHVRLVVGDEVDARVAERIREELLRREPDRATLVEVRVATRFEELSEQMSQAELVVASRYHNLICALRLGRPVVSLSYGVKSAWLMERFGLQSHERPIERLDPDALLAELAELRRDGETLAERIRERADDLRKEALFLLDDATRRAFASTSH
jgi:polysaccharide pyruvyl transferase WcaK-like protein/glycosyltransferase involved in cell wall biosynthesis